MHLVYFDESGNSGSNLQDQQPVFVLGALIVPEECWRQVEIDLEKAIEEHMPELHASGGEVHATNLRNGAKKGPFAGVHRKTRDDLRDAWYGVAAAHKLVFTYRAIQREHYEKVMRRLIKGGERIDPQVPAFMLLAKKINDHLVEKVSRGIFISDSSPGKDKATEDAIRRLRLSTGVLQLTNVIEKGFFIDSKKSRILQLCDVCTLYARKGVEIKVGLGAKSQASAESDGAGAAGLTPFVKTSPDTHFNEMIEELKSMISDGSSK